MRKDYDPGFTAPSGSKEEATHKLSEGVEILAGCRTSYTNRIPNGVPIRLQAIEDEDNGRLTEKDQKVKKQAKREVNNDV